MRLLERAKRRAEDDGGAVVVIVAICIVALLAMAVLTIDVGGLMVKRRHMVNASDAAALAAAQSCSSLEDTLDPETQADAFAAANVDGLLPTDGGILPGQMVNCDAAPSGYVTVEYADQQPLFFAGVLGFGDEGTVRTRATAAWGPAGGTENPLPLVLNQGTLQGDCPIGEAMPIDTACYLWYDNDRFTPSNFGFLDLEQWNVPASESCDHSGGSDAVRDYINSGFDGPPFLTNAPSPTYVCSLTGASSGTWSAALASLINGPVKWFPVNDEATQIMKSGQIDKWNIIGFAAMQVGGVWKANKAPAECNPKPGNASAYCVKIIWKGFQQGGICCGENDWGVRAVMLCDRTIGSCPDQSS